MQKNNDHIQTIAIISLVNKYINISLVVFSFLVPFFFSNYQIFTGSFVNALLFVVSSRNCSKKYLIPIIILPSLAVFSRSLIFGPFTKFLLFFMPFIWVANWILIFMFQKLKDKKYPIRILIVASIKTLFLFSFAKIYFSFNLIPQLFLQSMGVLQFVTAIIGGVISYFLFLPFSQKREY